MKPSRLLPFFALVLLAPFCLAYALDLRVEPDGGNVTAGRLTGLWEPDPVVSERMGLKPRGNTIEFLPGEEFLDQLQSELSEALSELRLYESGTVIFRMDGKVQSSAPYLLTVLKGNPHLITFRARDGDPLGDAESANLFVAHGKTRPQDLLLMGGDFNNEPFRPYRRVVKQLPGRGK